MWGYIQLHCTLTKKALSILNLIICKKIWIFTVLKLRCVCLNVTFLVICLFWTFKQLKIYVFTWSGIERICKTNSTAILLINLKYTDACYWPRKGSFFMNFMAADQRYKALCRVKDSCLSQGDLMAYVHIFG